jgi:hypothetical protein
MVSETLTPPPAAPTDNALIAPASKTHGTTLTAPPAWLSSSGDRQLKNAYICPQCGHVLRVTGLGRHRVYFEPDDGYAQDPVTDRACPSCRRGLPGKNSGRAR